MPDPQLILKTMGLAAAVSAAVLLLLVQPRRAPNPTRKQLGWLLGVASGFLVGCWLLDLAPRWPPTEDRDRLLGLVLPLVIVVQCLGTFDRVPRWLVWSLRTVVAMGFGRVLLHGSIYIADLAGPGTRQWNIAQTWAILGGTAALLMLLWAAIAALDKRRESRALPLVLAMTSFAAGMTIMLSGYATGGQLGFPLSAAIIGATVASLFLARPLCSDSAVGFALVAFFSLIVVGRFFAELKTLHALLLMAAPLWCAIAELPFIKRFKPWAKNATYVGLVSVPLVLVLVQARHDFVERSQAAEEPSADSNKPSLNDYMNFRR